ncbi:MAG: GNAT family N-acyltransferase [Pseudomonadota bacterium]
MTLTYRREVREDLIAEPAGHALAGARLAGCEEGARVMGKVPDDRTVLRPDRRPDLAVRFAETPADIEAAQRLRYDIFVREMGARVDPAGAARGLDIDPYDDQCDHLLVEDTGVLDADGNAALVGTYRLLRGEIAGDRFYSAGEFDIAPVLKTARANDGDVLELGRSCVAKDYRTTATIQHLWRGIGAYLARHGIVQMIGCASFPGSDPAEHRAALSWLHHNHLAEPGIRARVLEAARADVELMSPGEYDMKAVRRTLPPLIKAYLRVGAKVGEGAFIDRDFNTVDVFMVMPVSGIARRYAARFAAPAEATSDDVSEEMALRRVV